MLLLPSRSATRDTRAWFPELASLFAGYEYLGPDVSLLLIHDFYFLALWLLPLAVKNEDPCSQDKNNKGNADSSDESFRKRCLVTNLPLICCDIRTKSHLKLRKEANVEFKTKQFYCKRKPGFSSRSRYIM